MSLNMPSRRLLQRASTLNTSFQHLTLSTPSSLPATQIRTLFGFSLRSTKRTQTQESPEEALSKELKPVTSRQRIQQQMMPGKLESDSIFSDEIAPITPTTDQTAAPEQEVEGRTALDRSRDVLARAIDPDPANRVRWQRKMVIRHVAKATDPFSKESRMARIKRTEREMRQKSHFMPTSVKKLVHLARQIAGKPLDEALVQMQYSKKKMAREIALQLEIARDRAIVERGMGLGKVQVQAADGAKEMKKKKKVEGDVSPAVQKIQLKDGRWMEIEDPTRMYIAQAWVERGPWRGMELSCRARGRADKILKPSTGIQMILKEEKTRIREHKEREEKKYRQGPWVHLPDRPISAQRQYYSW